MAPFSHLVKVTGQETGNNTAQKARSGNSGQGAADHTGRQTRPVGNRISDKTGQTATIRPKPPLAPMVNTFAQNVVQAVGTILEPSSAIAGSYFINTARCKTHCNQQAAGHHKRQHIRHSRHQVLICTFFKASLAIISPISPSEPAGCSACLRVQCSGDQTGAVFDGGFAAGFHRFSCRQSGSNPRWYRQR